MAKKMALGGSMEHFGNLEMFFFKTGVFVFGLFLVSVIPAFGNWVMNTHWAWFLGVFVVCWVVVIKTYWKK